MKSLSSMAVGANKALLALTGASALTFGAASASAQTLENPASGSTQSGLGLISGWVCDAETVQIAITDGPTYTAGYGTDRADTSSICGDKDNGFGLTVNYNSLGSGEHTATLLIDGVESGTTTFSVLAMSTGEFATGLSKTATVADFPTEGHSVTLEWSQAQQNFNIVSETIPDDPSAGTGLVFDDGVLDPQYKGGMGAFDEAAGWASCVNDGGEACPSLSWEIVDDETRGSVLEITYADEANVTAGFFFNTDTDESVAAGTATGLDMSAFASGTVNFDVKVIAAGSNTTGWVYKQDCFFPCTSGDKTLGTAGLDGWQTVSVPVADLLPGLDLTKVSTGLVLWPAKDASGFKYRLDNVYWSQ